jgi:hypothetical protein
MMVAYNPRFLDDVSAANIQFSSFQRLGNYKKNAAFFAI